MIAEPSLVRNRIKHYKDSALVMVTDGITFVMSNEEIAKCVMLGDSPKEAAEKIVDQAGAVFVQTHQKSRGSTGASLSNGPFVFQPGHLIFTNCFS